MSWNFILLIFINVCQVWIVIGPGINYVHSPDGELSWECPGIIKTMHTGFSAYTYCIMPTPSGAIGENRRYDLAWKDLCSVLNASQ